MLARAAKAAFYSVASPAMRVNALAYRVLRAPTGNGLVRLHLGPGQKNYAPGFINIDANKFTAKCDLWMDLRQRLPFKDGTVDAAYSHHVIEHLPNLEQHFRDVFRCLKSGGVYRVGGPNGDVAIEQFVRGNSAWFDHHPWPDRRKSIGGQLENFLMCRGEHVTILTFSFLQELLIDAGFASVKACMPKAETDYPHLFAPVLGMEMDIGAPAAPCTLMVEAVK